MRLTCVTLASVVALATCLAAQRVPAGPAPIRAEGAVWLDGQPAGTQPTEAGPVPIEVQTRADRATISVGAVRLFLDADSLVRVSRRVYNYPDIHMTRGAVVVMTPGDEVAGIWCGYQVKLSSAGRFRFDHSATTASSQCRFRVFEGAGAVQLTTTSSVLRQGEMMLLRSGGDLTPVNEFDASAADALDRWVLQQLQAPVLTR